MRVMRFDMIAAATALLIAAGCGGSPDAAPDGAPGRAAVARTVDGDTIVLAGGESVRVANVDTPELRCRCAAECRLAAAARDFTATAVEGGVSLSRLTRRDRYGRTLARVTLADGRDLGAALIAAGLGRAYRGERRAGWC